MAVTPAVIVECRGDGRERGRAHGEALREQIGALLERWDADVASRLKSPPSALVSALVQTTGFVAAIGRHTPDLLAEVRGIAEAAGVAFERILALNLMDEEWWFTAPARPRDACSVLAIAPEDGRPTVLAQNMDLPALMDGAQAVLRIADRERGAGAVLTAAGMIGLTGVNAGAAFLAQVPHASGQHYALADRRGVAGYECSAAGAVRCDEDGGRLRHTNHPLRSGDLDPERRGEGEPDSHVRLAALATAAPGVASGEDCERVLADRDAPLSVVPEPGRPWITFGSIWAELGAAPRVRVAPGPPDRTAWLDCLPA